MSIRTVSVSDVSDVRVFVDRCKPLTLHTAVTYGVLFRNFSELCFVFEDNERIIGFLAALRGTSHSDAVYVWQLGVSADMRGQGISHKLLDALAQSSKSIGISKLHVGIEPSNDVSLKVFESYARKQNQSLKEIGQVDFADELSRSDEVDVVWELSLND